MGPGDPRLAAIFLTSVLERDFGDDLGLALVAHELLERVDVAEVRRLAWRKLAVIVERTGTWELLPGQRRPWGRGGGGSGPGLSGGIRDARPLGPQPAAGEICSLAEIDDAP